MGSLEHFDEGEVAWNGKAQFKIFPEGSVVEVWERVVPFGGPAPDFELSAPHHEPTL
ncbi:hypothetical protein AB0H42_24370 [Nocardia sp. NPDC050799]|uniref:hypothetical protein n=1 Tax=Nocardia sp. NPDC050799 TaxID=3154842 RepID=UPI0033E9F43C